MKMNLLIIITLFLNSCGTKKPLLTALDSTKDNKIETLQNSKENNIVSVEYTASTRGYFKQVIINSKLILVQNNIAGTPKPKPCSKDNWATIIKMVETVNPKTLSKLIPPSKAHQHDGAAIGRLKIITTEETYQTEAFDDGNPPTEITDLVNTILKMSKVKKN